MKLIRTEEAEGQVLCHDITRIIKGGSKGPVFKKGHVVRREDIPVLLSVGKDHLYVWEKDDSMLHEDEAAMVLYEIAANKLRSTGADFDKTELPSNLEASDISEGKIELRTVCDGLLKVDRERLLKVNSFGQMMIACRHGDTPVKKGDKVAGMRVIPLVIEKEKMERVKAECAGDVIFHVLPYREKDCAVITTGNEVFYGRIEDTFTDVIREKLSEYGGNIVHHEVCPDDPDMITGAINRALEKGVSLVVCTGGMSVDPDDRTPLAIRNTGARIVSYGAPVLPGAMLLLAYTKGGVPILGLPGCVMYARRTAFDLILPRIMADDRIEAGQLALLGEGGLCLGCDVCTYPVCGFGKA